MLPDTYRYAAYNASGASSDVTVKEQAWKFDSNGAVSYGSTTTQMNAVTIADASHGTGSTVDNSTNKYIGATLAVSATGSGTSGVITIFLQFSPDGGTTWPDAQEGIPVGSLDAGDSEVTLTV